MALDDLLDGGPTGPRRDRDDALRDRRRSLALGMVALLVTGGVGAAVGVAASRWGDDAPAPRAAPTAGPTSTPTALATSSASPSPPVAPPSPSPTPSPSAVVVGNDLGYLREPREVAGSGEESGGLQVQLDRVQFFTGQAARDAARKDGADDDVDVYVVNDNPRLRALQVRRDAVVEGDVSFNSWAGGSDGRTGLRPRTLAELVGYLGGPGRDALFDLGYDADGFVVSVRERFLP